MKFQKQLKTILLVLALVGVFFLFLYQADKTLRVRTIRIQGIAKGQELYGLDALRQSSMVTLRDADVADLLKKNNPQVARVQVAKQFPDILTLTVTLYQPTAYLKADTGYLLLSSDGRVLARVRENSLLPVPIISYYEKISYDATQPGSFISLKDILTAMFFIEKTEAVGLQVNTVDIDGVDMIGLNLDGKVIVFSSDKDREMQVYQMEQIVHQFRIQGRNFRKMDLRFNKPVLELIQ